MVKFQLLLHLQDRLSSLVYKTLKYTFKTIFWYKNGLSPGFVKHGLSPGFIKHGLSP